MKKYVISLLMFMSVVLIFAIGTGSSINNFVDLDKNPAVLTNGNFIGIGVDQLNSEKYDDFWKLYFLHKNVGYSFDNSNSSSSIYLASKLSKNNIPFLTLHTALQMNWLKKDIQSATLDYSFLYRPHNKISLGLKLHNIEDLDNINFSLSLRP
ncbi:MAG: hypothetical protein U9N34_04725, partial [Candidatus Cloacimonadota bacterium]|nr:hypothetical protein [Candidatus Cloacimonadota bacterium]